MTAPDILTVITAADGYTTCMTEASSSYAASIGRQLRLTFPLQAVVWERRYDSGPQGGYEVLSQFEVRS